MKETKDNIKKEVLDEGRDIYCLKCLPPEIDLKRLLRTYGYRDLENIRDKVKQEAIQSIKIAKEMASPKFFIRTVKVSHLNGGRLVLSDGTIFSCLAFDHYLENCGSVCVFVATLGGDIDLCIQKSFGDNFQPLQALCLGTAGWLMIEATTRSILTYLQSDFSRQGKRITMRLGPGYNYPQYGGGRTSWDLSEQLQLFNLFKGVPIPISLTEGFSMQPTMSRSGLVGLSKI